MPGYVIPGISYVEVLEILSDDHRFKITQNSGGEPLDEGGPRGTYNVDYSPDKPDVPPAEVDDIFNIDRHGEVQGEWEYDGADDSEYPDILVVGNEEDMKNTWLYSSQNTSPTWNAILDVLGDDYFGLTEYDELYADYVSKEPPTYRDVQDEPFRGR